MVLSAAGGDSFTCVACNTGVIIVWGTIEGFGVLKEPTVVPCSSAGIRFVKVVCGAQHVIALSETGQVYSFGANGCGQLGIGRISDAETHLIEVSRLKRIRVADIAAGGDMSMVFTESSCLCRDCSCRREKVLHRLDRLDRLDRVDQSVQSPSMVGGEDHIRRLRRVQQSEHRVRRRGIRRIRRRRRL